jgi:ERCC4-type nuclease
MRPLAVGEYLWVLRLGPTAEEELVLDYVIERKTWDDLRVNICVDNLIAIIIL